MTKNYYPKKNLKDREEGVFYGEEFENNCCEKCHDVTYEKTWPSHSAYHACINLKCECHSEKQGIEKVLEEISVALEGRVGENKIDEVHGILRSAIETAFKEVSTADFSRQTARIFKNEAHQRGYIAALSDYDQAVDKYLGK